MRRIMVPLMVLVLVFGNCTTKEAPTFPWNEGGYDAALSKAKADGDKLLMVEFSTDWCSWCKRLAKDTWPDAAVIAYASENLIALEVDAEKGDGIELAKKFHVGGFPTMVFVNTAGEEIDRIPGYLPADQMVLELTRIVNGTDTYPALKAKVENNPNDPALLIQLASKVEDMSGLSAAIDFWVKVPTLANSTVDQIFQANFKIAQMKVAEAGSPLPLREYIRMNADSPFIPEAYNGISGFYRKSKDADGEASALNEYVAFMESKNSASTQLYNGYAWRMTELGKNLEDALKKVDLGLKLMAEPIDSTAQAQVLDTKAEVLWKLGRIDDAVQVMERCIAMQPNDEYYLKQKAKFLSSGDTQPAS